MSAAQASSQQTVLAAPSGSAGPADGLAVNIAAPNQELWAENRIRDYEASLEADASPPLAVLTIDKLGIQVPVYNGTDEFQLNRGVGRIEGTAAVVEIESGSVLARFDAGPSHGGIDVVPGGRFVATVAIGGKDVLLIDQTTLTPARSIEVGKGPHGVRASPDGRWLYVGLTGDNEIAVIDMETFEVVRKIATDGEFPFWLAIPGNR